MCCLLTMNGTNHCLSGLLSGTGKCGCGQNPDVSEGSLRGRLKHFRCLGRLFGVVSNFRSLKEFVPYVKGLCYGIGNTYVRGISNVPIRKGICFKKGLWFY